MSSSLIFWLAFAFTSTQLVSSVSTQSSLTPSTTPSTIPSTTRSVASTPTPSSSKDPQVHIIKAGAGGFKFEPQQITNVSVGDIVSFEFYPPDHSVARAEFGSACVPYEYTGKGKTGFWSDTQNVTTLAEITHYNVTVNSTEPIFFYCAAPKSCTGELMVGAINPNSTQTLEAQIASAKSAQFQVKPGDPMPKEGDSTHPNDPSSTPSPSTGAQSDGRSRLRTSVITGIAVGIVAFLGLCAALFFYIGRSKSLKDTIRRRDEGATMKPVGVGGGYTGLGYSDPRQSAFSPLLHTPQGVYPQDFAGPLPTFASPRMSVRSEMGYHDEPKVPQGVVAELHSPTFRPQEFAAELEAPHTSTQQRTN